MLILFRTQHTSQEAHVSYNIVEEWNQSVFDDETTRQLVDSVWNVGLRASLMDHRILNNDMHLFSHQLVPHMKAADQLHTGLCWAFAGLAWLRRNLAEKHLLPHDFELSQTFILFHDKLEKAHAFLQNVEDTKQLPLSDRMVHYLMTQPVPDGGGWESFEALVRKYGVVPKTAMKESASTRFTGTLQTALTKLLLQAARRIRADEAQESIADVMKRVHRLLCVCFGTPPKTFRWTFHQKSKGDVYSIHTDPRRLFEQCGLPPSHQLVMMTSFPTKEFNKRYTVERFKTVLGSDSKPFVNVDAKTFHAAIHRTVQCGTPVWFACEFDYDRNRQRGILHHELMRYERVIGESIERDPQSRLESLDTDVNHAMLITGYHEEKSSVVRWQVENSHGSAHADGYITMSDEWLRHHVFTAVVPRQMLSSLAWSSEPVVVPPWDVFGQVARVGRAE